MGGIVWMMEKDDDGIERLVHKEYLDLTPKERREYEAQKSRSSSNGGSLLYSEDDNKHYGDIWI